MSLWRSALGAFESVRQLHENPRLVATAQTIAGRLALFAAAALLLRDYPGVWFVVSGAVAVTLLPTRRHWVLATVGAAHGLQLVFDTNVEMLTGRHHPWKQVARLVPDASVDVGVALGAATALTALVVLCFVWARSFGRAPDFVRSRPQVLLHATFWATALALWSLPAADSPWRFALVGVLVGMQLTIWRLGYMLLAARRGRVRGGLRDHLFYLAPFYAQVDTLPYGKGPEYLTRNEAPDAEALARSQLAGLKLFVLGHAWLLVRQFLNGVVYADQKNRFARWLGDYALEVPRLTSLIDAEVTASLPWTWASVYLDLIRFTLNLAVMGHFVVGSIRLCGFNVFRNTYKPLLAESVVDFWGRFHHYYKELLVQFFFFPIYLRRLKGHARLRTFVAVFAAAFVGNMYTHLINHNAFVSGDLATVFAGLESRSVYCASLALGVYVSMRRQELARGAKRTESSPWEPLLRARRILGVWTFYALIHIWSVEWYDETITAAERARFVLGLFGLGEWLPR